MLESLAQCRFAIAGVTITHTQSQGEEAVHQSVMRLPADCQEWVRPSKAPCTLSAIVTVNRCVTY